MTNLKAVEALWENLPVDAAVRVDEAANALQAAEPSIRTDERRKVSRSTRSKSCWPTIGEGKGRQRGVERC